MNPISSPRCRSRGIALAVGLAAGALLALAGVEAATALAHLAAAVHLGA
ncbi:MAG TPA: hypothetical protein VHM00_01210 [Caldimonas sp.]|jgi:hypothetical protein|nr:hypothetical protein [Caldimonas sp.]HEX2539679.1 hypothetical protein [Caldimonas sp.]